MTTFIYKNGKMVEGKAKPRGTATAIPGQGDSRGLSLQLPRNYKYAKHFTKQGHPMWMNKSEAEDNAKRARDHGERIEWEK